MSFADNEASFLRSALGSSALPTDTLNDLRAKFYKGTTDGSVNLSQTDALALRRFRAALANRATTRVNMCHIGDSVTAGFRSGGASPTPSMSERWTTVLANIMRNRFPVAGVAGGLGWVPAALNSGAGWLVTDNTLVYSAAAPYDTTVGLHGGARWLNTGQTATLTFTGTGVDILYRSDPGSGTFNYAVDGGAATPVNTNAATAERVVQIRGLAAGSHTLVISYVSNFAKFCGFYIYNGDETTGIGTFNMGWTGIASNYWSDPVQSNDWPAALNTLVKPDLVTIGLGLNDQALPITPAQFKTNLVSIINRAKTALGYTPSFVLMPFWQGNGALQAGQSPWNDYVAAMYSIVADDPYNVCVFDLRQRVSFEQVPTAASTNNILYTDNKHLSTIGNQFVAESLAQFISPR